jgi:hypothetical protein
MRSHCIKGCARHSARLLITRRWTDHTRSSCVCEPNGFGSSL